MLPKVKKLQWDESTRNVKECDSAYKYACCYDLPSCQYITFMRPSTRLVGPETERV